MTKPYKPWRVQVKTSTVSGNAKDFTSKAKAYDHVAALRNGPLAGTAANGVTIVVYQHDGTRWALYERIDLGEETK